MGEQINTEFNERELEDRHSLPKEESEDIQNENDRELEDPCFAKEEKEDIQDVE